MPFRRLDFVIINNKKRTCWIVNVTVPANHIEKIKESEKRVKYLDFAREVRKLWNVSVMVIPIVCGGLGKIHKYLVRGLKELEIGERIKTI